MAPTRILRGLFLGLNGSDMRPGRAAGRGFRVQGRTGASGSALSDLFGLANLMSHNTFGHLFRVTTFGESHGPAIGCVVDGCPPGIALTEADIQRDLERRRPGQSKFVSQRQEPDTVKILSGVFQDERMGAQLTTGTPIGLVIENVDQRSRDYSDIRDKYRPGHADYTYDAKYGLRDYRGGGRQSARETAMRVAAGAIARKVLDKLYGKVTIRGALVQMGTQTSIAPTGTGRRPPTILSSVPTPGLLLLDGISRRACARAAHPSARSSKSSPKDSRRPGRADLRQAGQ